jgi:4-hydroxybenzoate polyprenyltransferase
MRLHALAERRGGGRLHGFVYLVHPGPSLLVTVVFIAAAALARRSAPSALLTLQLVLLMLPAQFAIGAVNDVADVREDAVHKPWKPMVRGSVSRRAAVVASVVFIVVSLGAAALLGAAVLVLTAAGIAGGLAHDLWLRKTPLSVLPWWIGLLMLPVTAFAVSGRLSAALLPLVPLTLLIATALHLANALPDIGGDRSAGRRSMPVLLGATSSRCCSALTLMVACFTALTIWQPAAGRTVLLVVSAVLAGVIAVLTLLPGVTRPFPVLAPPAALLAVGWIAGAASP